jgi:hypothetical protein
MTTIKQVIEKLQTLADNLELGVETPVLIPVNAFVQGGVQVHIIDLDLNDVNYEPTLEQYRGTEQTSGIVIGFIPKIYNNDK